MATKNDLLQAWAKWTGEPIPEVRHRFRALSEQGLLPDRAQPIGYDDVARSLLAFLASPTHKDAPALVQRFAGFQCTSVSSEKDETPFINSTLLEALIGSLQPPFVLFAFKVNQTDSRATLTVGEGWEFDASGQILVHGSHATYEFVDATILALPDTVFPVSISKMVDRRVINRLTDLLTDKPACTSADPETTKAAGAPPPNGLRAKSKQAAKPASAHTAQLTHTHQSGQSPDRGLSFPPSSEKAYRYEHEPDSDFARRA